jgi:hypothetical protein
MAHWCTLESQNQKVLGSILDSVLGWLKSCPPQPLCQMSLSWGLPMACQVVSAGVVLLLEKKIKEKIILHLGAFCHLIIPLVV